MLYKTVKKLTVIIASFKKTCCLVSLTLKTTCKIITCAHFLPKMF